MHLPADSPGQAHLLGASQSSLLDVGTEIGANEKEMVIGNEAVFTRMPLEKEKRLTGMDLLRLALERAEAAANDISDRE